MSKFCLHQVAVPSIVALFIGGVVSFISNSVVWSCVLWSLAFIWLIIYLLFHFLTNKKLQNQTDNWIDSYKRSNNQYPSIPDFILPLVIRHKEGDHASKDIQLRPMSGQYWNRLLPSQRDELRQLVEWLGMNWDDYYELMKRMLPRDLKLGKK